MNQEPIGERRLNRTLKVQALNAHNAKQLARIAIEAGGQQPQRTIAGATAGGDERKLRGIPALARGVGGAINGTRPGDRT